MGRVIWIFGFHFDNKTKKMQKFTVHKVPTIDVIDELVGLNIFKANLLKICYHREINNNMKTW